MPRTSVSVPVFSSCRYMCTTSVSTYFLSSVCFKWHKSIVKRHTPTSEERTSNQTLTQVSVFLIPRSVDCSDFTTQREELDNERHTT